MNPLIRALANLDTHGHMDPEFHEYTVRLIREIKGVERDILCELGTHHEGSLRHSLMVAQDVWYILKHLGYSEEKSKSLFVAALLHDVGKISIHQLILDLGYKETCDIWRQSHPEQELPPGRLAHEITLKDTIEYLSRRSDMPSKFKRNFKRWLKEKGVLKYYNKSVYEYLQHHQISTHEILSQRHLSPQIVFYAATHHPDYFAETQKAKLPEECHIIEIADIFNAIIQSEGVRHYIRKKSKIRALTIIADKLKEKYGGLFQGFERKVLGILLSRYLPSTIQEEIIPIAKDLIRHHAHNEETIRLIDEIQMVISLNSEYRHILSSRTMHTLKYIENTLQKTA